MTATIPLRNRAPRTEDVNLYLVFDTLPRMRPNIHDHELVVNRKGEVNTWLELKFLAALEHGTDEGMSFPKRQQKR